MSPPALFIIMVLYEGLLVALYIIGLCWEGTGRSSGFLTCTKAFGFCKTFSSCSEGHFLQIMFGAFFFFFAIFVIRRLQIKVVLAEISLGKCLFFSPGQV
ncbi:hypothetical protein ILYODFUR_004126 [Ilyodon furcidens]|uniref:Uncharacterized protein n=1 Tax=Ilyodon furcidens TaxID=33524 RepID=A0ABV0SKF9_9TELE